MNALLGLQQVSLLLIGSGVLGVSVFHLAEGLGSFWCSSGLMFGFFAGHCLLAVTVARRRLAVTFPVTRQWGDVFAVFGAFWLGPLVWLHAWKDAQCRHPACELPDWPTVSKARLIWLVLLIVTVYIALVVFVERILGNS